MTCAVTIICFYTRNNIASNNMMKISEGNSKENRRKG